MCEPGSYFVLITEAAQLLGITEVQVLMMLEVHELQGEVVDGTWRIDRSSLNLSDKPKNTDITRSEGCGICGSGCGGGC